MRARVALLTVLFGCASAPHSQPHQKGTGDYSREDRGTAAGTVTVAVTVAVTNAGGADGPVTIRENGPGGRRLYSQLMPGQTACIRLSGITDRRLYAESLGGGINGPTRYSSDLIRMTERPAWSWRLNGAPGNGFFIHAKAQCGGSAAPSGVDAMVIRMDGARQVGGGWGDNHAGYTSWGVGDSLPYGWVREDLFEHPGFPLLIAHERSHRQDERLLGSQAEYERMKEDPAWSLMTEARAYCNEGQVWYALAPKGHNLAGQLGIYAGYLSSRVYYPHLSITRAEAENAIRRACGLPPLAPQAPPGNGV